MGGQSVSNTSDLQNPTLAPQGCIWLLTIPQHEFLPYLPAETSYIRGQLERGNDTGFLHWQLLVHFRRSVRLAAVKRIFGNSCHAELSRSSAADSYVWKEDTRVSGTSFELGRKPFRRGSPTDWQSIVSLAQRGQLDSVPGDILVRYIGNLQRIGAHFATPEPMERECFLYWGATGLGKSRRAWSEAGLDAYPKCPFTKFWDGYRGQNHVVCDEFRGSISVGHLLRWLDRYPVLVEIKGSVTPLRATKIWFTSNIPIELWYPDIDSATLDALKRRIKVTHFVSLYLLKWGTAEHTLSKGHKSALQPPFGCPGCYRMPHSSACGSAGWGIR